jgi:hypothetical protein
MGRGTDRLQGHGETMPVNLKRAELLDLHSVLRRALERAERQQATEHAEKLAREIAALNIELARVE